MENKSVVMKFTGCKHLDFNDIYAARKQILGSGKVFWLRCPPDDPGMVQFCKLRGRLNHPESCLSKRTAQCSMYAEQQHTVAVPDP